MIMPVPGRRHHDIAPNQGHFLAFNGCEAFTRDDEAARVRLMSMGRRRFARIDELEASVDCVCCVGSICTLKLYKHAAGNRGGQVHHIIIRKYKVNGTNSCVVGLTHAGIHKHQDPPLRFLLRHQFPCG